MADAQRICIRKLGFQPGSARGHLACGATAKVAVGQDSQGGYLPQKETK